MATSPAKKPTSSKAAPAAGKGTPAKTGGHAASSTVKAARADVKAAAAGTAKAAKAQPAAKAAPAKAAPAKAAPAKSAEKPTEKAAAAKHTPAKHAPAKHAPTNHAGPAPAAAKEGAKPAKAPARTAKKAPAGIVPNEHFDAEFLEQQRTLLRELRAEQLGQAERLEGEAASLMEEQETGDVQFDEESGEGDTIAVERERDLALSAQARQTIADIDAALLRIADGTYGYSAVSGLPIPRERLEALPWATALVQEKVGGLGTRR